MGDELSIKVGEIIKDVKRMDGGWWEGSLNGRRGVFPDNFVKVRSNFRHIKIRLFSWNDVGKWIDPKLIVISRNTWLPNILRFQNNNNKLHPENVYSRMLEKFD